MSELRTNRIVPRDGIPSGASGGGIVQVVFVEKSDTESLTSTSTPQLIPGLSATITPTRSDSKILVQVVFHASIGGSYGGHHIVLRRGSTNICIGDAAGSRIRGSLALQTATFWDDNSSSSYSMGQASLNFLDSPATTSATTYGLYHADDLGNALYVNRARTDSDNVNYIRVVSTITLMEVSG
tara:strand:+ start:396 stop:944 length:549 start_codon:yes stop_codon:yes gene_type:complete